MKKNLLLFLFVNCSLHFLGQVPGEWVWKSGSSIINYTGSFGTKGVPSLTNKPPAMYEACEWTDNQGNFWLYGGTNNIAGFLNDLWKYDPVSNQWTWMFGPGISAPQAAIYGTTGVPGVNNTPGMRTACYSWKDNQGNLWLFGGYSLDTVSGGGQRFNDLWKYDITLNQWTFMKGDKGPGAIGYYGSKGIEDPLNRPPSIEEMGIAWTSNDGNLWLLSDRGCLWRYNILNNNWTWMKGDGTSSLPLPVYGIKGVPNVNNTPGITGFDYARWKDSQGNFWYYYSTAQGYLKVLWKYEPLTDMWTWMHGDTTYTSTYDYGIKCNENENEPLSHIESRTCWTDPCNNLWMMGGYSTNGTTDLTLNDLIYFDTQNLQWVWVDNSFTQVAASTYGTMGVSGSSNTPASRSGAMPFHDSQGNLWLYGGANYAFNMLADLWMYTIDTSCTKCYLTAGINANSNPHSISIYPNPSNGSFIFSGLKENSKIEIYDVIGRAIFSTIVSNDKISIDISGYPKGIYFYQIIDKKNQVSQGKIFYQ